MARFLVGLLLFSVFKTAVSDSCNKDNCLRAMEKSPSAASSFCTPYLATSQTATTEIPTFLANCKASTSRLSSACSCIITTTPSTTNPQSSTTTMTSSSSTSTTKSALSSTQSGTTSTSSMVHTSPITCSNSIAITESHCTSTTTITVSPSTVTKTVTSVSTASNPASTSTPPNTTVSTHAITSCSSASPVTVTSVSTVTTTVTSTLTSCTAQISGGNFESLTGNLGDFTVTQNPPGSIFMEVIPPSSQEFVTVPSGVTQILYLNYVLLPIPTSFTLEQPVTLCNTTTSVILSATVITQTSGATIQFCISPSNCSPSEIVATGSAFETYSATFQTPANSQVAATMTIAADGFVPMFFAGVGEFSLTAT